MFTDAQLQQLMLIAGLGVLCWMVLRKRIGRRRATVKISRSSGVPKSTAKLQFNANAAEKPNKFTGTNSLGAPADVLRWQVELHDLGRELKAELDSKMLAVRSMTQQYDRAAHELKQLIDDAQQLRHQASSPLAMAQALNGNGWSHEKIAEALGLQPTEVDTLLTLSQRTN